jgi:hypothetical protein
MGEENNNIIDSDRKFDRLMESQFTEIPPRMQSFECQLFIGHDDAASVGSTGEATSESGWGNGIWAPSSFDGAGKSFSSGTEVAGPQQTSGTLSLSFASGFDFLTRSPGTGPDRHALDMCQLPLNVT